MPLRMKDLTLKETGGLLLGFKELTTNALFLSTAPHYKTTEESKYVFNRYYTIDTSRWFMVVGLALCPHIISNFHSHIPHCSVWVQVCA